MDSKKVFSFWITLGTVSGLMAMAACQDLPASAINGYRAGLSNNAAVNKLQGVWSTACAGSGPYTQNVVAFSGTELSVVKLQFASKDSTTGLCQSQEFEVTIGKDLVFTSNPTSTTQNVQSTVAMNEASVSPGYAAAANSSSFCGLTNWHDGQSIDPTGKTCLGVVPPSVGTEANETITFTSDSTIDYSGTTYTKVP